MQDDRIDYQEPTPEEAAEEAAAETSADPKAGKKRGKRKQSLPGKIMTGEIFEESKVRSHYPFALYCCVLIVAYIAYVFNYQRLQREEIRVKIELQEERSRAMVFSSMRMNASRHSNIIGEIERRGLPLIESSTPPRIIDTHPITPTATQAVATPETKIEQ